MFDTATAWHHARLTAMENDQDALLELFELALTWHELEYSQTPVIPPDQWMVFVENHRWSDPDRVERIFSVATDLVMTAGRANRQRPQVSDGHFWQSDIATPTKTADSPRRGDRKTSAGRPRERLAATD